MIKIREIKPNEYQFLREMLYEAIFVIGESEKPPKSILNELPLSKYVDNFGKRDDFAFVLADKNELLGAVWSRLFPANEAGYGFFDEKTPELSIAIKKNFRNQGFGVLMIQKLVERLKPEGFDKLSLSVDKRSPAVNLYRRIGFEIIEEEGTAFTMLKKL